MSNDDRDSKTNDEADDENSEGKRTKGNPSPQQDYSNPAEQEKSNANLLEPQKVKLKRGRGRPKGSKNKKNTKDASTLTINGYDEEFKSNSSEANNSGQSSHPNNSTSSATANLHSANNSSNHTEDEEKTTKSNSSKASIINKNTNSTHYKHLPQINLEESPKTPKSNSKIYLQRNSKNNHDHQRKDDISNSRTEQVTQQFIQHSYTNDDVINQGTSIVEKEETKDTF